MFEFLEEAVSSSVQAGFFYYGTHAGTAKLPHLEDIGEDADDRSSDDEG